MDVQQGDVTVDVAPYLSAGSSVVKINVADVYGNNRTLNLFYPTPFLALCKSEVLADMYYNDGNIDYSIHQTGRWKPFYPEGG